MLNKLVDLKTFSFLFRLAGEEPEKVFSGVDFPELDKADLSGKLEIISGYSSDFPFFHSLLSFYVYDDFIRAGKKMIPGLIKDDLKRIYYFEFILRKIFGRFEEPLLIKKFRKGFLDPNNRAQTIAEIFTLSKLSDATKEVNFNVPTRGDGNGNKFDFQVVIDGRYFNFEVTYREDPFPPAFPENVSAKIRDLVKVPDSLIISVSFSRLPNINSPAELESLVGAIDFIIANYGSFGENVELNGASFLWDMKYQTLHHASGDTIIDTVIIDESVEYGGTLELDFRFLSRATVERGWASDDGRKADFETPESKEIRDKLSAKIKQLPEGGYNYFVFFYRGFSDFSIKAAVYGDELVVYSRDLKESKFERLGNGLIKRPFFKNVLGVVFVPSYVIPVSGVFLANPYSEPPQTLNDYYLISSIFY